MAANPAQRRTIRLLQAQGLAAPTARSGAAIGPSEPPCAAGTAVLVARSPPSWRVCARPRALRAPVWTYSGCLPAWASELPLLAWCGVHARYLVFC